MMHSKKIFTIANLNAASKQKYFWVFIYHPSIKMSTLINSKSRKRSFNRLDEAPVINNTVENTHKFLVSIQKQLIQKGQPQLISELQLSNIKAQVAKLCNISESSVYKIIKQGSNKENNRPSLVVNCKKRRVKSPQFTCDSFTISYIRRVTQKFYSENTYPTLETLWKTCREADWFPKVSQSTFHRWLIHKCKFKYRKVNKKPVYLERIDIVVQRANYLRKIKHLRSLGYKIYFTDETWASPDQARNRCWLMHLTEDERRELDAVGTSPVLQDMKGWAG